MRRISMVMRDELVKEVAERCAGGDRAEKTCILDELAAVSGLHRKHAMRLLRSGPPAQRSGLDYNAVREALVVLWEASDRICGKRLKMLIPILVEAMDRHGHLHLTVERSAPSYWR
ncbi:hypothetical protein MES4922_10306 [Mesorhizobium ventifaucium]|uniref:Transposase n=1 Tax=Mesorhizobium ventifaucium TaxID=666020 RepID=A0ABM9DE60_9HYPH|nr:hypothetical protein MES4922_10306 [Mesorhizobium ventifaucium]